MIFFFLLATAFSICNIDIFGESTDCTLINKSFHCCRFNGANLFNQPKGATYWVSTCTELPCEDFEEGTIGPDTQCPTHNIDGKVDCSFFSDTILPDFTCCCKQAGMTLCTTGDLCSIGGKPLEGNCDTIDLTVNTKTD